MPPKERATLIIGCFGNKAAVFTLLWMKIIAFGKRAHCINAGIMGTTELIPVAMEVAFLAEMGRGCGFGNFGKG